MLYNKLELFSSIKSDKITQVKNEIFFFTNLYSILTFISILLLFSYNNELTLITLSTLLLVLGIAITYRSLKSSNFIEKICNSLLGILYFIAAIMIMFYSSGKIIKIDFVGFTILLCGIFKLTTSILNTKYVGWIWSFVIGSFDIILGILLLVSTVYYYNIRYITLMLLIHFIISSLNLFNISNLLKNKSTYINY